MSAHLAELLSAAAAEAPDRVALVEAATGRRMTWAELDAEVDRVARGLDRLGLVAGYRVVIALGNRVEFVTSYLGALRAGLVAVPVNPRSTTGELVRLLADCGARVVVTDVVSLSGVREAVVGLEDALVGADEELRRRTASNYLSRGAAAAPHRAFRSAAGPKSLHPARASPAHRA